jgi:type IV fimbrial biogenesis protein FimT
MEKYRFLRRSARGFTLIEMMVTVALMVILGTMAAPALQSYVTRSGMQTLQNDFIASLNRARSEAVARNTCVSMCQLRAGTTNTCETSNASNGNWELGWIMFEYPDCNTAGAADPFIPSAVIMVRQPGNMRFTLTDKAQVNRDFFTFNSRGVLRSQTATLALADSKDTANLSPYARNLKLSAQGRVQVQLPDLSATTTTAAGGTQP